MVWRFPLIVDKIMTRVYGPDHGKCHINSSDPPLFNHIPHSLNRNCWSLGGAFQNSGWIQQLLQHTMPKSSLSLSACFSNVRDLLGNPSESVPVLLWSKNGIWCRNAPVQMCPCKINIITLNQCSILVLWKTSASTGQQQFRYFSGFILSCALENKWVLGDSEQKLDIQYMPLQASHHYG